MIYNFEKRKDVELVENYLDMGETNPNGDTIYANNLYYTINGKPFHPVMGEICITRNPRSQWKDRILKMKAQGINIISSYLLWINHEFYEGEFDFTGDNDIGEFIRLCQENGMYFALRFGPWVTSECRNGGLPNWLHEKNIKVRDSNDEYLFYVRRWYQAVYDQVKDYLYKNGGNIIIIQIDNELVNDPDHLLKLRNIANEIGFSAPLYTATGWSMVGGALLPKKEMIPMFGGYAEKPWAISINRIGFYAHFNFSHVRNSADVGDDQIDPNQIKMNIEYDKYPYSMAELGMGLCTSKHRRPYITTEDNYAFAITKLGSGCNLVGYYVNCGGINKMIDGNPLNWDDTGYQNITNIYPIYNYDFQAAISEHGSCTPTHRRNKIVNYFLNDFGGDLAVMQPKLQETSIKDNDTKNLRYAMRINGESGYVFVNHHCHMLPLEPVNGIQFKVLDNMPAIPEEPMNVTEDDAFFFPFNQIFGNTEFNYITAQPLCRTGNTLFFKEIKGVKPVYSVKNKEAITAQVGKDNGFVLDGFRFITLTDKEAECLYKFDGVVYIARDCDLIYDENGVHSVGFALGICDRYEDGTYIELHVGKDYELADVEAREVENPDIDTRYQYEFFKNRDCREGKNGEWHRVERKVKYYEINVTNPNGYVYINYSGDSAQLYYDGVMSDDDFYTGHSWIIPASHFYGRKVVLAIAEFTHDIYVEVEPKQNMGIDNICVKAV